MTKNEKQILGFLEALLPEVERHHVLLTRDCEEDEPFLQAAGTMEGEGPVSISASEGEEEQELELRIQIGRSGPIDAHTVPLYRNRGTAVPQHRRRILTEKLLFALETAGNTGEDR